LTAIFAERATMTAELGLHAVLTMLRDRGCRRVFAKCLAPNDNSKNQVYFGGGFQALNVMPYDTPVADQETTRVRFKAHVDFWWLMPDGNVSPAPGAQLILYPQYPEVRFSGFLRGSSGAPGDVMSSRETGRVLVFGIREDGRVFAWAAAEQSAVAADLAEQRRLGSLRPSGVFDEVPAEPAHGGRQLEVQLLVDLGRIHRLGWIDAKRLRQDGSVVECRGPNCGGSTLEAELGVAANSRAAPDYLGYEVKQHKVSDFGRPASGGAITLMTPEPTGGLYRDEGVEAFIRTYGYSDKLGRPGRMNVGGIYRVGARVESTGLRLTLLGWDAEARRIVDGNGGVALLDDSGRVAAIWPYTGLIGHWRRKHNRAVYVPSMLADNAPQRYCYGDLVRLGEGADFLRVLDALHSGVVYYDPGIKLEWSTGRTKIKRRSQFRVRSSDLDSLYNSVRTVGVL